MIDWDKVLKMDNDEALREIERYIDSLYETMRQSKKQAENIVARLKSDEAVLAYQKIAERERQENIKFYQNGICFLNNALNK